jgi:hypothetical protein
MADNQKDKDAVDVTVTTDDKTADLGTPTPASLRRLAEDLPEKDTVQKAYKEAMLADTAQQEARAKVKAVDASPDAADTPSGGALKKVAGVSNDTERGEKYLREKTARRWGYAPVDAS